VSCRYCGAPVHLSLVDLGTSPPSNAYLSSEDLLGPETWFPLRVVVCEQCWLVQTEHVAELDNLFNADYAYFSGYSSTWVDHCRQYADEMVDRLALDDNSQMVEVASNDGTLLRCFQEKGVGCTGIEPTASTAAVARALGLTVVEEFLSLELAERLRSEGMRADLITANNVLAHVPDVRDFAAGCATLLASDGVATFEFPHVVELVTGTQFDTIYHEHFSYLSLVAVEAIFSSAGLVVFDVERIPTHGGSLRVFAQRAATGRLPVAPGVDDVRAFESELGVETAAHYTGFKDRADQIKTDFLTFLLHAKSNGLSVAAYGAAAKGNTLLNYAGIRPDLVSFVADRNPAKQGMFLPGSRIPIVDEAEIERIRPDHVVILPWNLSDEITGQLDYIRDWSGSFVTAIPKLTVW
jgi:SAM-dependent methyltransferase